MQNEKDNLSRLLTIMQQLRDPQTGCPWDCQQTFQSIVPHTIEEAYEVADAIASGNKQDIKQECGDLLFQVVFYAQLAKEEGSFDFDDIAKVICDKLVRRHPHVFQQQSNLSMDELNTQWQKIKQQEKQSDEAKTKTTSTFADIPSGLPSLIYAHKLQKACAKVGFDWPEQSPVLDKVKEEIAEIQDAIEHKQHTDVEEEIGDAFFALVNLARHHKIDADQALRKACHKFKLRFEQVEDHLIQSKQIDTIESLSQLSLEELEHAWHTVKKTAS